MLEFKPFEAEELIEETKARAVPPDEAAVVVRAREFRVTDQASHRAAKEMLVRLATLKAKIRDTWKEPKAMAHKSHRAVCAGEDAQLGPIMAAEHALIPEVVNFEQAEKRREEAERARLEAEERKRMDDLALAEAAEVENQGQPELAAAMIEEQQQAPAPAVVVPSQRAQVTGVSTATTWTAEVVDAAALMGWLATQDPETIAEAVEVKKAWLNRQARAMKKNLRIPGLRPREDAGLRVRAER